jgi:hypothetical protein
VLSAQVDDRDATISVARPTVPAHGRGRCCQPGVGAEAPSAAALSASDAGGDFNNDGFVDLAAGAPWERVGSLGLAGAVSVLPGSAGGLTATGGQLFTQNSPGVPGLAEAFDRFGGVAFNAG